VVYQDLQLAMRKGLHRDAGRALGDAAAALAGAAQLVLGAGPETPPVDRTRVLLGQ